MKNHRVESNLEPFTFAAPPDDQRGREENSSHLTPPVLACRSAAFSHRSMWRGRLFRIGLSDDSAGYWETEVRLDGEVMHRRFASRRLARAWLALADGPCQTPGFLDLVEQCGKFRLLRDGKDVPAA